MRISLACVLVVGILGWQSRASAQEDPYSGDDRQGVEKAREYMEQGQTLYAKGEYAAAASAFEAAHHARPFSAFLYNAAMAQEKAANYEKAADFLQKYIEAEPNAPDVEEAKKRISELRTAATAAKGATNASGVKSAPVVLPKISKKDQRDFKSLLSVRAKPEDAKIIVRSDQGKVLGTKRGPLDQTLPAGRYTVVVKHDKYQTIERPVTVGPGKVYVILAEMSQGRFLGTLRVVSKEPGADVYLNEHDAGIVGRTPYQTVLAAGKHVVWVSRPGFHEERKEVELGVGAEVTIRVGLKRVSEGKLSVTTNVSGARVYADGKPLGATPLEYKLSAGVHKIRVEAKGKKDWEGEVDVERGKITPIRVRMRPSVDRGGAWVTAVLSAVLIGGSIGVGIWSNNIYTDMQAQRDAGLLASDDSRFIEGQALSIGANIGFGLGAVLAGLATYYFLRDPLPDSEAEQRPAQDWAYNEHGIGSFNTGLAHLDVPALQLPKGLLKPFSRPSPTLSQRERNLSGGEKDHGVQRERNLSGGEKDRGAQRERESVGISGGLLAKGSF